MDQNEALAPVFTLKWFSRSTEVIRLQVEVSSGQKSKTSNIMVEKKTNLWPIALFHARRPNSVSINTGAQI